MKAHSNELFTGSLGKILIIGLGKAEYGIPILDSKEVIGLMQIEPLPQVPPHILGVINLRGRIIPVIDLRVKLGLHQAETSKESCIVVVESEGRLTGTLVDRLIGVTTLDPSQVQENPSLGDSTDLQFIEGIAIFEDRLITILNMIGILSHHEVIDIHEQVDQLQQHA